MGQSSVAGSKALPALECTAWAKANQSSARSIAPA